MRRLGRLCLCVCVGGLGLGWGGGGPGAAYASGWCWCRGGGGGFLQAGSPAVQCAVLLSGAGLASRRQPSRQRAPAPGTAALSPLQPSGLAGGRGPWPQAAAVPSPMRQ